jgi:hypothetical protein
MKPIIKICLNETYSNAQLGNNLSDISPVRNCLKQRDDLSPLFSNFVSEYAIRRVQVNQDGLKLIGTYQFLFYADDVDILDGSVNA